MKKWAIITGATSGIGYATALKLAQAGWNLIAVGRRIERLHRLQQEVRNSASAVACLVFSLDMSKISEIESFIDQNQDILSEVSVLVNNAGLARSTKAFHQVSWVDLNEMIDVNIKGLFRCTHLLLPFLLKNAHSHQPSHIINLGSVAGRWSYAGGAVYCATKFSVRAFSESLRMDLLGQNIRVTNIEPGMVQTEFSDVRFRDSEKAKDLYKGMRPLLAEDIAATIDWCLHQPAHVNIQELVIYPTDQAAIGQVHRSQQNKL